MNNIYYNFHFMEVSKDISLGLAIVRYRYANKTSSFFAYYLCSFLWYMSINVIYSGKTKTKFIVQMQVQMGRVLKPKGAIRCGL